jgi:hypothetical protein
MSVPGPSVPGSGMDLRRRRRLVSSVAAALAATAMLLAVAHLMDQHRSYGEWSWSAPSPTPLLPFRERSYVQQGTEPGAPPGLARIGVTWDGLPILGPPGVLPPSVVVVQAGPHGYVVYARQGGP